MDSCYYSINDHIYDIYLQSINEGVLQRTRANLNGVAGFTKGLFGAKSEGQTALQAGHESRYGNLAKQYIQKIIKIVEQFSEYLSSVQQTMNESGMSDTYNQYVQKVNNIIQVLTQNAQTLGISPDQIPQQIQNIQPQQPQQAQPQQVQPQQPQQAQPQQVQPQQPQQAQYENLENLSWSIFLESVPTQNIQPQQPQQVQPQQPQQTTTQNQNGNTNIEEAKKAVEEFWSKVCDNRSMEEILAIIGTMAGQDPNKILSQVNVQEYSELSLEDRVMLVEGLFGNGSPTEKITSNLKKFEKNLSSTIGEMSADLKDMGFNKKFNEELKQKTTELKQQLKTGAIDKSQFDQQLAQIQQQMNDSRQNESGIDGVINQLRKSILQNVDVSLRGNDGMSGKQGLLQKLLHWGGRAASASLIGFVVNSIMPGFSALGMAGPYVSKALTGGALSVVRDASMGQLDKDSLKRALIGASIGALAQFGKEIMSSPEIIRTGEQNIGNTASTSGVEIGADGSSIEHTTNNITSSTIGNDTLVGSSHDNIYSEVGNMNNNTGHFSGQSGVYGDINTFHGKAGNFGTLFKSLFDQNIKDQLGQNGINVDLIGQATNDVQGALDMAAAGKMGPNDVANHIQSARSSLQNLLNQNQNVPEETKKAIIRQFDYSAKKVMGKLAKLGNNVGQNIEVSS